MKRHPEVTINFQAPKQLQDELRQAATARERSVSAELRLAARAWLDALKREARETSAA